MRMSDWSSDVCSSDLGRARGAVQSTEAAHGRVGNGSRVADHNHGAGAREQAGQHLEVPDRRAPHQQPLAASRGGQERLEALKRSAEHTSELQSLMRISYAVFCLKKTKTRIQ